MSWLKSLFGGRAIKQFHDTGAVVDTRHPRNLINEWNSLHSQYEKLNKNWSPMQAGQLVELMDRMRLIEQACIMRHMMATKALDLSSPELHLGDIRDAVRRADDPGIACLEMRIAKQASADYQELGKAVIETHPELSDSERLDAGLMIWRCLSSFYELATVRELGGSDSIYVRINVRSTMSGFQKSWLDKHGISMDRDEAHAANTALFEYDCVGDAMDDKPERLGKLLTAMLHTDKATGHTIAKEITSLAGKNEKIMWLILHGS